MDIEWGDFVSPKTIKEYLDRDPSIKEVFTTLCETSTGTLSPIKEIGEIVRNREGTLLTVDAISGLGACDIEVDKWHVDICVAGSQKGLMLPPGLAFASVSEKAWKFIDNSKLPKYYFDFNKAKKSLEKGQNPYTPAVSLIVALKNSLDMIKKEGIDKVLYRHQKLADATRTAVRALGLELLSKKPANAVTAVKVPEGIDGIELVDTLDKKYGIRVAGGQAHLKGKIFRIAHLGYMDRFDIITVIAGLEMTLFDLGYKVEIGKGVKAAEEILKDLE
ncbi:MAG TPA: alanine--glyoxylate aminotransferase family protein [bacterium (Candidatus Stahlbacteria)]|nr:alanine--glyoxylate aminotransferase family protein [Candidatus Stahlbacteria bacterium]